ncbi:MAG: RagB/SusD family nutrient uptake outer membrane protein [Cyclobacteriaceae bacterium]|nr:RagB/SusD family nutrient uptake outer membrane protein [Cyclobacteriaceae bacterium SS2]
MKNILIILIALTMAACSGLLEENPETFISPDAFYTTVDEATAAVYAAYDILPAMYRNPYMTSFSDVASNSFIVTSASATDFQPFDIHTISPSNSRLTDFWEFSYRGINRVNAIIDRVPDITGDEGEKNELIGEAKFLRAFFYFNMVRLFGDVPIALNETTSLNNLKLPRSPKSNVYQQIVADLEDAISKLPDEPKETGRADINAARGILARVQLTLGSFSDVVDNTSDIISSGEFYLWESYSEAFLERNDNGKESIFAIQFEKNIDGNNLNSWSMPPVLNAYVNDPPLFDLMEVSAELENSYETGDQRKSLNAVTEYVTSTNDTIRFQAMSFKYSDGIFKDQPGGGFNNAGNSGVNYPILRYADVLLMHAEAVNEVSGPTTEAFESLNMVRRRAFGVDISSASAYDLLGLDQDAFRQAVWLERFRELPHESHQYFDLIRTGRAESTLNVSASKLVYPIPQREIDVNDQLTQNPDYN